MADIFDDGYRHVGVVSKREANLNKDIWHRVIICIIAKKESACCDEGGTASWLEDIRQKCRFFIAVGGIGIAALTAGSPISHLCAK